ncbi:MAG TPA: NUDIX domain-containing protein [Draconibacterium sp.]|nr:NUDIX domain-containing protein [Draconibacterium sp.]
MYKVFLNEKLIRISGRVNITLNKPTRLFEDDCTAEEVKKWFELFSANSEKEVFLIHSNPADFFELFQSAFIPIQAAGGVVIRKNRLLFIFRNEKWDLPKGKIDEGETAREAALREVEEECGISGHSIVKRLPPTYHMFRSPHKNNKGEWIFKETFWFEMKYYGEITGTPQLEEGITLLKWYSKKQLDEVWSNTYENLKPIISIYRD